MERNEESPAAFAAGDFERSLNLLRSGTGGRTRTGTILLSMDFESITSANSITPAFLLLILGRMLKNNSIIHL